jgi:neutral ceramidase
MTTTSFLRATCAAVAACLTSWTTARAADSAEPTAAWKAGTASVKITPEQPMWMAGYASRTKPSEGTAQDLFAKALALEDEAGTRLVIVTMDLISVPHPLRQQVEKQVEDEYGLPPRCLLLNASHTHCGPELREGKAVSDDGGAERARQAREYSEKLARQLVDLVGQSLERLEPARLGYSHARCGFAMNRRLKTDQGWRNSSNPDGPVDHDVPVLRVDDADGKLRAVLFGYACHNTTLQFYNFCGDYAGYAQEYLEHAHPGVTAHFMLGCGGDQNPYPRSTLELAEQHGRSLANAVEAALLSPPRAVRGSLRTALEEVELEFDAPTTREELVRLRESGDKADARRAARLLDELERTGKVDTSYRYPVQVIQLGDSLTLIALAGEVVVDYAVRLKRELAGPSAVWIAGYSNDVFAYIPSRRVLEEGGYEGREAILNYSALPGPFAASVEERIVATVHSLVRRLRGAD